MTADDVVRYTLENHPEIVAARGDVEVAAAARRVSAVFLSNPEVEGGVAVVGDLVQAQAVPTAVPRGRGLARPPRRVAVPGRRRVRAPADGPRSG